MNLYKNKGEKISISRKEETESTLANVARINSVEKRRRQEEKNFSNHEREILARWFFRFSIAFFLTKSVQNPKIISRKDEATGRSRNYYFLLFRVHSPCAILTAGILILMVTFVDLLRGGSHDLSSLPINVFPSSNGPGRKDFVPWSNAPFVVLVGLLWIPSFRTFFARFSKGGGRKGGGEDHAWRNFLLRARLIRRSSTPSVLLPLTSAPRRCFV